MDLERLKQNKIFENINMNNDYKSNLLKYEKKHNISSNDFFDKYENGTLRIPIRAQEAADWYFDCICFKKNGGNLNNIKED